MKKIMKALLSTALVLSVLFSNYGMSMVHAENYINSDSSNTYYYKKTSAKTTYLNNGTLYSYLERRKYPSVSGSTGSVDYYVYAKYSGSKTVSKIMSTWTCKGTYKSSYGSANSVSVGTTSASVSTSTSGSYNIINVTSYLYSTNGTELAWYSSNYIVELTGYVSTSMVNEGYVMLKGESIATKVNASA